MARSICGSARAIGIARETAERGQIGAVEVDLDGGPFMIEGASTTGNTVYYRGRILCLQP